MKVTKFSKEDALWILSLVHRHLKLLELNELQEGEDFILKAIATIEEEITTLDGKVPMAIELLAVVLELEDELACIEKERVKIEDEIAGLGLEVPEVYRKRKEAIP